MRVELFVLCMFEGSYKQVRTDDCVCVCDIKNKGKEIKELASF